MRTKYVDDLALVEVDPPIKGPRFTLEINPIKHLILMARHEGFSLFPYPPKSSISVNIYWTKDLKIPTEEYIDADRLIHISIGQASSKKSDIEESLGLKNDKKP